VKDVTYKLDELARAAGTSVRTVRYYVQRGLLPAPAFRGKDTAYEHDHLVRLRAIRRLQDAFFPLDAIAVELGRRSFAEIERIADGTELPAQAPLAAPMSISIGAPPATPTLRQRDGQRGEGAPSTSGRVFHRIEIAPGVELSVAEDAPPESRVMAERILGDLGIK
jgi:Ca-activated chloride channel family protein